MIQPKSPLEAAVEQAMDLMVYGPLGLALTAKEELPRMVDKGRKRLGGQVMLARMIGQHATRHGQKVASQAIKHSTQTLVGLGFVPGPARTSPARSAPAGTGPVSPAGPARARSAPVSPADHPAAGGPGPSGNGRAGSSTTGSRTPLSADLAIPGYDSLSASQVVQRLAGLSPGELEAVRGYEGAGRGRRTILNRIAQLQSGRS